MKGAGVEVRVNTNGGRNIVQTEAYSGSPHCRQAHDRHARPDRPSELPAVPEIPRHPSPHNDKASPKTGPRVQPPKPRIAGQCARSDVGHHRVVIWRERGQVYYSVDGPRIQVGLRRRDNRMRSPCKLSQIIAQIQGGYLQGLFYRWPLNEEIGKTITNHSIEIRSRPRKAVKLHLPNIPRQIGWSRRLVMTGRNPASTSPPK